MEFDDLGFTDAMVDTAFALGWRQATVESLTISLNDHMTGRALQRFATMSSLRKLVVSRCRRITREDIHAFFSSQRKVPSKCNTNITRITNYPPYKKGYIREMKTETSIGRLPLLIEVDIYYSYNFGSFLMQCEDEKPSCSIAEFILS